ncbi:MAG: hypothetical protein V4441_04785 [Pseudomonadota bacterium]
MMIFLKLTASVFLAVFIGLGSAYVTLYSTAKSGHSDPASSNPYERAAYALRDVLPGGRV